MQIRSRANNLEFLRANWDKEAKRTRQKLIKPSEFTPEERKQYNEWVADFNNKNNLILEKTSAELIVSRLRAATRGIDAGAKINSEDEIFDAISQFQAALKRAGILKPGKVEKIRETKTGKLDL